MRRLTFGLGCILVSAGCANPPVQSPLQSAEQAQCFWASQVSGFSDAGQDRALLRMSNQEMWELTLSPGCPDVNWAMKIGIVSRGGQRICTDRPAELIVPSASGRSGQRCLVRSVRKVSRDEAAIARGEAPR